MNAAILERLEPHVGREIRLAGMGALVALTLLAGHLHLIQPGLDRYRALVHGSSGATLAATAERVRTGSLAIEAAERDLEGLRTRLSGRSAALPLEKVESHVIEELDRISIRHAIQLVRVTPGAVGEVLMFDELPYEVEVSGTYFSVFDWLREVERDLRPLVVNRFEIRPERGSSLVVMKLRLVSYRPRGEAT